jgi:hypothetical protein
MKLSKIAPYFKQQDTNAPTTIMGTGMVSNQNLKRLSDVDHGIRDTMV